MTSMTSDLHDAVAARIKTAEGRYTRSRRLLVEVLLAAGQPLTVDEIAESGHLPLSSVYRNLAVLEDRGLVHRLAGHGDFARFELTEELVGHHDHLVCVICGAMTDVDLPQDLEQAVERALVALAARTGFELVSHRIDAIGRCSECVRLGR
jgi:Fur family transcriptional regulator, ferric uptake regulator